MDIAQAREIRSRFLTHPVTISIFIVLILLYAWLDVGQTVPDATNLQRVLATLGGAILYYGGFYLLLPWFLSSTLTAQVPFFWQVSLLMVLLLLVETALANFTIMSAAAPGWMANYVLSSIFTGLVGVLAFCTVFRFRLTELFGEDPLTGMFRFSRRLETDPLQQLLPDDVRGPVLQFEAQAPYVLVTTTNGTSLVRTTLRFAMQHVDQDAGWLVHRSRWVHKSRVIGLRRKGKNRFFVDPLGQEFPISRDMEATLKSYLEART